MPFTVRSRKIEIMVNFSEWHVRRAGRHLLVRPTRDIGDDKPGSVVIVAGLAGVCCEI